MLGTRVNHGCPYTLASFSESTRIPKSLELVTLFTCRGSQFVLINQNHNPESIDLFLHLFELTCSCCTIDRFKCGESSMEDSDATTVESLRAQLLSERSVSKVARQRVEELAKRVRFILLLFHSFLRILLCYCLKNLFCLPSFILC